MDVTLGKGRVLILLAIFLAVGLAAQILESEAACVVNLNSNTYDNWLLYYPLGLTNCVVNLAAGTYTRAWTISAKNVQLLGPETARGLDPRPNAPAGSSRNPHITSNEAIFVASISFTSANLVTVDGLSFQGAGISRPSCSASPCHTLTIRNCFFSGSQISALNMAPVTITNNYFEATSANPSLIPVSLTVSTSGLIANNYFKLGTLGQAIQISDATNIQDNVFVPASSSSTFSSAISVLSSATSTCPDISSNLIVGANSSAILLYSRTSTCSLNHNIISGCNRHIGAVSSSTKVGTIHIETAASLNNNSLLFNGNDSSNSPQTFAIKVQTPSVNVVASGCSFVDNDGGLFSKPQAGITTDATGNWWGHSTGAGSIRPGFGDPVDVNLNRVYFDPQLTSAPNSWSLATISVQSPTGYWVTGNHVTIRWNAALPGSLPQEARDLLSPQLADNFDVQILDNGTPVMSVLSVSPFQQPGQWKFSTELMLPVFPAQTFKARIRVSFSQSLNCQYSFVHGVTNNEFELDPMNKTISILEPNSTTNWTTGHSAVVRWQSTGYIGSLIITLHDGTTSFQFEEQPEAATGMVVLQQIPIDFSANQYSITVASIQYPSISAESQSFTLLEGTSFISITKPTIGALWTAGFEVQVAWKYRAIFTNITFELVEMVSENVVFTIEQDITLLNTTFQLPFGIPWSLHYSLRGSGTAVDLEGPPNSTIPVTFVTPEFEVDEEPKSVVVFSLGQSEYWETGREHVVEWESHGYLGLCKIYIWSNDFNEFVVAPSFPCSEQNNTTFFLPAKFPPTTNNLIRIESLTYPSAFGSGSKFEIDVEKMISLITLDCGEVVRPGQVVNITWTQVGNIPNLELILYAFDSNTSEFTIIQQVNLTSSSHYRWTVQDWLGDSPSDSAINVTVFWHIRSQQYPHVGSDSNFVVVNFEEESSSMSSFESSSESDSATLSSSDISSEISSFMSSNVSYSSSNSTSSTASETSSSGGEDISPLSSSESGSSAILFSSPDEGNDPWLLGFTRSELAIIVAIASGGILFCCLLTVIVLLCFALGLCALKKRHNGKGKQGESVELSEMPALDPSHQPLLNSTVPLNREGSVAPVIQVDPNAMKIDFEELVIDRKLAQGAYGVVFQARWGQDVVAVKKLTYVDEDNVREFENEIRILAELRHENIVLFCGACVTPPNFAIVTEFCSNGSLHERLHKASQRCQFSWEKKIQLLTEIARGLNYLHRRGIIHRDMKSHNVLLTANFVAKVADFGLSRTKQNNERQMTQLVGTPLWMAPEVTLSGEYNETCDVYSFGIMLYEMLTERVPYWDHPNVMNIQLRVANDPNFRPTIPSDFDNSSVPPSYLEMMTQCWDHVPSKRPTLPTVIEKLREMAGNQPNQETTTKS